MLITEAYKGQVAQLHRDDPSWGTSGRNFAGIIHRVIEKYQPRSILDYGCGKQTLARALPQFRIMGYDPGVPGLSDPARPAELTVCTDVMEHIEPECLDEVLTDLQRVTRNVIYMTVATAPAIALLPDGRNAHLIVQPLKWWLPRLMERFDLISIMVHEGRFDILMKALTPQGNGSY